MLGHDAIVECRTTSEEEQIIDRATEAEARAQVRAQAIEWLDAGYMVTFNGYRACAWEPCTGRAFSCATRSAAITVAARSNRRAHQQAGP